LTPEHVAAILQNTWTKNEFRVSPLGDFAVVEAAQEGGDPKEVHTALVVLGNNMTMAGFTVNFLDDKDEVVGYGHLGLVHHLRVGLVRAEEKILWGIGPKSPNFPGLMASGPLVREEGMLPRRVVLSHEPGNIQPFCVHTQAVPDGKVESPALSNGNYSKTRQGAMRAFLTRVKTLELNK
jgi:hypothetical protein